MIKKINVYYQIIQQGQKKGDTLAPNILPGQASEDLGGAWVAWLLARISLDEATALIRPGLAPDSGSAKP